MIALGRSRSSRIGQNFYFILAFIFLTLTLLGLERAREAHNALILEPDPEPERKPLKLVNQKISFAPKIPEVADHPAPKPTAQELSPQVLLARNISTDQTTVPKLFHQSWVDDDLPKKFQEWSQTCREKHPDWKYVLWTNKDNRDLVMKYAPWFLDKYNALGSDIMRADSARNIYMHVFGGVYADLDIECLRPIEELLEEYAYPNQRVAYLGSMGTNLDFSDSIPNAWMTSTPGHPFWLLPLKSIMHNWGASDNAEGTTGPSALRNMVIRYYTYEDEDPGRMDAEYAASEWRDLYKLDTEKEHRLEVLPSWEIYPYNWSEEGVLFKEWCSAESESFDAEKCKGITGTAAWGRKGSFAITYWSHTWGGDRDGHLKKLGVSNNGKVVDEGGEEMEKEEEGKEGEQKEEAEKKEGNMEQETKAEVKRKAMNKR